MTDNANPSRNPANSSGDISGGMREILAKFLQSSIDDMLPAKIVAYDRDTNRATIKLLIAMIKTSGDVVSRNQLASIPVLNIGGGGCILSFNLVPGDLGYIKATDRDIAAFLKNYSESTPSTKRIHDFSNGVFIPDVMTGYTIAGEDTDNCVLQTLDGVVRVSLFPDKLKITAPLIEIDGPIQANDTLTVDGAVRFKDILTVDEAVILKDTLTVDGAVEAKSTVLVNGLLTAAGGLSIGGGGITGPLKITGDLEVTGDTDLGGTGGAGIARIGDTVTVVGALGTINFGSAKSRSK